MWDPNAGHCNQARLFYDKKVQVQSCADTSYFNNMMANDVLEKAIVNGLFVAIPNQVQLIKLDNFYKNYFTYIMKHSSLLLVVKW